MLHSSPSPAGSLRLKVSVPQCLSESVLNSVPIQVSHKHFLRFQHSVLTVLQSSALRVVLLRIWSAQQHCWHACHMMAIAAQTHEHACHMLKVSGLCVAAQCAACGCITLKNVRSSSLSSMTVLTEQSLFTRVLEAPNLCQLVALGPLISQ